ncbi:hypothetical protein [Hafnia phage Pocis76]|uniref:Uncharacterized protein n=1 Tax=Hafnia phage Pocis76 TaxID=2831174 RepID=A0A8E7KY02_9CAUD|nr:hypothetical protein [Hafnia phage Pocis76]
METISTLLQFFLVMAMFAGVIAGLGAAIGKFSDDDYWR